MKYILMNSSKLSQTLLLLYVQRNRPFAWTAMVTAIHDQVIRRQTCFVEETSVRFKFANCLGWQSKINFCTSGICPSELR